MRSIGLRASPKRVWFSVVESAEGRHILLLVSQVIPVPEALEPSQKLRFIRQTIADVIAEYTVVRAGIRLAEGVARHVPIERYHLDGVLLELFASSSVERSFYGSIAQIARLLGVVERADVKKLIEGAPFPSVSDWADMSDEQRESILVASAALAMEAV